MQKLYNTQNLLETHRGDVAFVKHIAQLFIHHMPLMAAELKRAYTNSDWPNVYFYAHKMKASIDLFGIRELGSTIRTIEQQAKTAVNSETLSRDTDNVSKVISECIAQLKQEFEISDQA